MSQSHPESFAIPRELYQSPEQGATMMISWHVQRAEQSYLAFRSPIWSGFQPARAYEPRQSMPTWLRQRTSRPRRRRLLPHGWPPNFTAQEILSRLLALNHERAATQTSKKNAVEIQ